MPIVLRLFSLKLEVAQGTRTVVHAKPGLGSSFCLTQISAARVAHTELLIVFFSGAEEESVFFNWIYQFC